MADKSGDNVKPGRDLGVIAQVVTVECWLLGLGLHNNIAAYWRW